MTTPTCLMLLVLLLPACCIQLAVAPYTRQSWDIYDRGILQARQAVAADNQGLRERASAMYRSAADDLQQASKMTGDNRLQGFVSKYRQRAEELVTFTKTPKISENHTASEQGRGDKFVDATSIQSSWRVTFVSFADGGTHEDTLKLLSDTAKSVGKVDAVETWNFARIEKHGFKPTCDAITKDQWKRLHCPCRCCWKPFVIREALLQAQPGDMVLYVDASRYYRHGFQHSVRPMLARLRQQGIQAVPGARINIINREHNVPKGVPFGKWGPCRALRLGEAGAVSGECVKDFNDICGTLREAGICNGPGSMSCCERFWNAQHMQATYSIWTRSEISMHFVNEWLRICSSPVLANRAQWGDQTISNWVSTAPPFHNDSRVRAFWFPNFLQSIHGRFTRWDWPPADGNPHLKEFSNVLKHFLPIPAGTHRKPPFDTAEMLRIDEPLPQCKGGIGKDGPFGKVGEDFFCFEHTCAEAMGVNCKRMLAHRII